MEKYLEPLDLRVEIYIWRLERAIKLDNKYTEMAKIDQYFNNINDSKEFKTLTDKI